MAGMTQRSSQQQPGESRPTEAQLQATLVDFALLELIRRNRDSFEPLWTADSWAKLLIWLALNCGLSGERDALEGFAAALGPRLTGRLRRVFFERDLTDLELQVLADPAEERLVLALERIGLVDRVTADRERWQQLDALVAIPWT